MEAKRATIYLEPALHKALKIKAAETSVSLSELVNEAVRESLAEDLEDIATAREPSSEPTIGYEQLVKNLKKDGLLSASSARWSAICGSFPRRI